MTTESASTAKISVFCPLFPPAQLGGGPIRTLEAMVRSAPDTCAVVVVTGDTDLGQTLKLPVASNVWLPFYNSRVRYVSRRSPRAMLSALLSVRDFSPDVVYLTGFFSVWSIVPQLFWRLGFFSPRSVILAPRGELGASALSLKSGKKRWFLRVYRLLRLQSTIVWHASSAREAHDVRRVLGSKVSVIVRENDTLLPDHADAPPKTESGALSAIYLGRIVRIKGLHTLLEGLATVKVPMSLDVVGPEEDEAYVRACRELAMRVPPHVKIRFRGAIDNADVRSTLKSYDVMFMPTTGENFGHVIAEALSVSCPVVAADTTPWTPVLRSGGGVVVDSNDPQQWSQAVNSYCQLGAGGWQERRLMAGEAYTAWKNESNDRPHLFSVIAGDLSGALDEGR